MIPYLAPGIVIVKKALSLDVFKTSAASYNRESDRDNDVVKITALTGAAACGIPNGRTLHSQASLSGNKVSIKLRDSWRATKMIIIDEVSFLDEDNIRKLDKHMRKLKENDKNVWRYPYRICW